MSRPSRAGASGFTLMETLVTLVIVSMVAAVLSQALYQFQRAERLMSGDRLQAQLSFLHRLWVRDAATALLAGTHGTPEEFTGSDTQWHGLSNAAPLPGAQGPTWVSMELIQTNEGGYVLTARAQDASRPEDGHVLLQWGADGERPRWRYQDDKGAWSETWPVLGVAKGGSEGVGLPRAIALVRGEALVVMAAPPVNAMPFSSRVDVEKLP